ncbi:Cell division protein FtsI/penicillin-binding protein 2 [alpha proteobacterium BAL199]|jgi:cell division protein FtsI (penicillin-binding protein 3)|nr:Cell division protein FtsI/penicillin-binding protein 2 [alpha proteobacterium BAL199]
MRTRSETVRLEGHAKQAIETGRNRLILAGCLIGLAFVAVSARVVELSALRNHSEPALSASSVDTTLTVGRADIVDRNGLLVATSLRTPSLYADPKEVLDAEDAAFRLATALPDINPAETAAKLASDRRFVWLKRNLTPREQQQINSLGIPGLHFFDEWKRVYPQGSLTAHVVGFTDIDDRGISGVERSFDDVLRGGREPLRLALDLRVQHIVRQELAQQIATFEAIGGAGVIVDVNTGETIAMVSLPDFDSNVAGQMDPDALFNRATLGVYEMGSTFKIFNTAMALEAGTATMRSGYDATNPIKISRFTISDYHAKRRWLSVPEIFKYSSNIGSVKMAIDVGTEGQRAFMAKLGMLRETALELPELGRPMVPNPWRPINTMTIAFGHGLSVSPMHLAAGVAAMVNGGIRRPLTILETDTPSPGERIISERTSHDMRRLMRLVVDDGTGRKADAEGYIVGGKTGTAEKVGGRGGYRRKALMSSFVAAFPMQKPRYVVLVMVDEPKGTKESHGYATGGWVAAPAISRIIARSAPLLGVAPVDPEAPEIRRDLMIEVPVEGGKRLASF